MKSFMEKFTRHEYFPDFWKLSESMAEDNNKNEILDCDDVNERSVMCCKKSYEIYF